jgi:hypothetical protein
MGAMSERGDVFLFDVALNVLLCFLNHSSCFSYGMLSTYVMQKPQKATLLDRPQRKREIKH